jgi:hypothetical protein
MQNEQRGTKMIIDTHVHAVSDDERKYPRQAAPGALSEWVRNMSAEMLLALNVQAGIDKTVLVQAYSAYKYDNSYTADCAASYRSALARGRDTASAGDRLRTTPPLNARADHDSDYLPRPNPRPSSELVRG